MPRPDPPVEDPNDTRPDAGDLVEEIVKTIEPESWTTVEGAAIASKNRVLVVRATPAVQEKVRRYVEELRERAAK